MTARHPLTARARRLPAALLLVALVALLLAGRAGPAQAHAALLTSAPFDGEELADAPGEVTLVFDEPVEAPQGAVRVHDATGTSLAATASQPAGTPSQVVVDLPDDLGAGGYVVTYRIVSADGHPVDGALVFTVGGADGVPAQVLAALASGSTDVAVGAAATAVRWAAYATGLLAAGAAVFAVRVAGGGGPSAACRTARRAALGGVVATALVVPVQAALATGRPAAALDPAALADVGRSLLGGGALLRAAALVALLVLLRTGSTAGDRRPRAAGAGVLAAAGLALASFLLDGHTVTTGPRALVLVADAVHLAAGAVWFGGLVCLADALREERRRDDPAAAAGLVARFSLLATVALAGVVVAGLALGWAQVRAPRALLTTPYGWALLGKLALSAVAVSLGAHANRRLVPTVTARLAPGRRAVARPVPAGGSSDAPPPARAPDGAAAAGATGSGATAPAWAALRRTVRAEAAVLVVVLLATAVLVNLQPAASAAGITGAYSTYVPLGDDMQLNLVVDPNRVGRNEVHLYVLDATGRPSQEAVDARIALTLPAQDIGPLERDGTDAGPGHWVVVGDELAVPGRWVVEVTVGLGRFEERTAEVPVTVNP